MAVVTLKNVSPPHTPPPFPSPPPHTPPPPYPGDKSDGVFPMLLGVVAHWERWLVVSAQISDL